VIDISVYDRLGIKDLPGNLEVKQLPDVGSHNAVQISRLAGPGSCLVNMGVTDSSSVSVGLIAGLNTKKACDLALRIARRVEPKLS
jgi:hypothetical protein